jgi:shikimate dehydrogenase
VITAKTRVVGLIGDPVEHSVSPSMHNAAFARLGLDYIYLPFRVTKERLSEAIGGLRGLGFRGLNVTIPHKVAVMPFLDDIEIMAERIGAVNTIVNDNGRLKGYNTDAGGFLLALKQAGFEPKGKKAVVLGAGGASRAISFALAGSGAGLTILNRREELDWAETLAGRIAESTGKKAAAFELNNENLKKALEGADLLVNATSLGMHPDIDKTPVDRRLLRPGLVVFDAVYNPLKTRLMREAGEAGATTVSGLDMLIGQGAMAFELWTGEKPPLAEMKKAALAELKKGED